MEIKKILRKLTVAFSCGAILLSSLSFSHASAENYADVLLNRVKACIEHDMCFQNKADMQEVADSLKENRYYLEKGSDDFRVKFVGTQGAIEHVMASAQASGEITHLVGVIHAPMPATPLCVNTADEPSPGLLDPSLLNDADKILTVKSRAQIMREYLQNRGKLIVTYPRGGLQKRSAEQQNIYFEALNKYPDQLFDWVLNSDSIADEWIGATYLFRDRDDNLYAFSIRAPQANDPRSSTKWGLWFGELSTPSIKQRVNTVFNYLDSVGGPDIRPEFKI